MAIYEKNNDVFFPEDYIVDIEDDDTYYLMESEALQTLSDFFGIDFKDMDEAMILVEENNDKDDGRVWVNKYELIDQKWNDSCSRRIIFNLNGAVAYFISYHYIWGMVKKYQNNQEKLNAMRNAIALRERWLKAVREGATKEEMEKMGLKAPNIVA